MKKLFTFTLALIFTILLTGCEPSVDRHFLMKDLTRETSSYGSFTGGLVLPSVDSHTQTIYVQSGVSHTDADAINHSMPFCALLVYQNEIRPLTLGPDHFVSAKIRRGNAYYRLTLHYRHPGLTQTLESVLYCTKGNSVPSTYTTSKMTLGSIMDIFMFEWRPSRRVR